tara:strand:- start:1285 stop:2235 length:951 start_codon:yes stop_codon:yes gene_type:complete
MSICTNEKLRRFGLAHFTFINQIFGDEGVREEIVEIWKDNKHKYQLVYEDVEQDSGFEDEFHHVIYLKDKKGKFSKKKKWCSVDGCVEPGEEFAPCYQDIDTNINDTLCQTYTLLKYLGYELPLETSPEARKQLQMTMIDMYRMIISKDSVKGRRFRVALNTFVISSWKDCRTILRGQKCPEDAKPLDMDTPKLLNNIRKVLDQWEAYGYHYFIGDGTCPSEDLELAEEESLEVAPAASATVPVATRTRRRVAPVAARTRNNKRRLFETERFGGKKLKKNNKKSKRNTSTKRKRSPGHSLLPTRRSKRLQNKQKKK